MNSRNLATLGLICAWPLMNFAIHNFVYLEGFYAGVAIILAIGLATFGLSFGVLKGLELLAGERNSVRMLLATCAVIAIFFSYQPLMILWGQIFKYSKIDLTPQYGYAFTAISVPLLFLLLANRTRVRDFIMIFLVVAVAATAVELGLQRTSKSDTSLTATGNTRPRLMQSDATDATAPNIYSVNASSNEPDSLPNIYHLVVDEYARADQLKSVLNFDNSTFIRELESRGFQVLPGARANYPYTAFSLSSMFAMDYPYTDEKPFKGLMFSYEILGGLNPVINNAIQLGYRYAHVGSSLWGGSACAEDADVFCLTPKKSVVPNRELELLDAVNRMTPLSYFLSISSTMGGVTTVEHVKKILMSASIPNPILLFAHTIPPHPPYIERADCSPQAQVQFYLSGGTDPQKYIEAVQCVNIRLIDFADYIVERDPDALVIFSSDHGSKFLFDHGAKLDDWNKPQFDERFGIFLAIRAPQSCTRIMNANLTLVNLYRLVFSCITASQPDLLENEFYNINYGAKRQKSRDYQSVYKFPADKLETWDESKE